MAIPSLVSISCSSQTLLSGSGMQKEDTMHFPSNTFSYLTGNIMAYFNSSRTFISLVFNAVSGISIL